MHRVQVKGILSSKNGMNLYRGCSHGCIYCDSRSKIYGMDHDFEDIEVKSNALELLERRLRSKRKKCMLGMGSMTDPYIPLEESLGFTRGALELALKYGFGITLITKSASVLRDLDLLKAIEGKSKCIVQMTLTTFGEELCKILEPHVSTSKERIEVLKILNKEGIATIVWLCPILPYINDTEENILSILKACRESGVKGILCFGMGLTLREGNREYFYKNLDRYFPGMKERYQKEYGFQYSLSSPNEKKLMRLFREFCIEENIMYDPKKIFSYLNSYEEKHREEQICFL